MSREALTPATCPHPNKDDTLVEIKEIIKANYSISLGVPEVLPPLAFFRGSQRAAFTDPHPSLPSQPGEGREGEGVGAFPSLQEGELPG